MDSNVLTKTENGQVTWIHQENDEYLVTGRLTNGRRFRVSTKNWTYAKAINVYRGNKWLIRNGKRYKIQSIYN
jgi:hypothetical protein